MILDLREGAGPATLRCDICVVGAGAAGLTIATEMSNSPLEIVLLESGGMEFEAPTQALYDVDLSGLPHPGSTQGRFRVCGGSTTMWGGQALPLMASDFEPREWVPHSGWPIVYEEMKPYYERASRFLLVDGMNFDTDLFKHLGTRPPALDAEQIWYHFSKWSPRPNLREVYLPEVRESKGCRLLLHANVVNLTLDDKMERVQQIEAQSLEGHKTTIQARAFVLGVGGIETARLLLANRKQRMNGIGNDHDLVGRFFQDHPSAFVGYLNSPQPARAQRMLNVFHKGGQKYSVRCTATKQWQQKHRTLNVSMGTTFVEEGTTVQDLKEIYTSLRQFRFSPGLGSKAWRTALHPGAAIRPAYEFLIHGRSFTPNARMLIGLTSEQEPNPESRILLSDKVDVLGMPRADVRWRLTDLTLHTIREFASTLREEFARAGMGTIEMEPWVFEDSAQWTAHITDQFHHIGTTRMDPSPRRGVVDQNCRVHGVENLFIGSSAVFPTSGHSNPTLTIIALCMRLADRLKKELE